MQLKLKIMGVLASIMLMVSAANAVCVQNDITSGSTVSGTWSSDCTSPVDGPTYYSQLYTFTLTEIQDVQIDLSSVVDTYINLIDDLGNPIGSVAGFPNSQLIMTLQAGTYTIDATTWDSNVSGDFSLSLVTTTPTPTDPVALESFVSGKEFALLFEGYPFGSATFSSDYTYSDVQNGTDTCSGTWEVISNGTISTTCGVDYVFSGEPVDGMTVFMNNTDPGSTGSVAVTFEETGTTSSTPPTCILNSITLDSSVSGSWSSGCIATNRTNANGSDTYGQYYSFTLTETTTVQIDLESLSDTYMYLLDDLGTIIDFNDDVDTTFGNNNSRIITTLPAGTYTIEATTFGAGVVDSFTLSLATVTSTNPSFNGTIEGTIDLPANTLALLQSCSSIYCPSVNIMADIYLADGSEYQTNLKAPVDYNDITGKYEYQLNVGVVPSTSIDIVVRVWHSLYTQDPSFRSENLWLKYTFGADRAVGGTGSDADYIMEDCSYAVQRPLHVDLTAPVPVMHIDASNYTVPDVSQAEMTLNYVPAGTYVTVTAEDENQCYNELGLDLGENGPMTIKVSDLMAGNLYGLMLSIHDTSTSTYTTYRLNDNDGDFTNGGVFMEGIIENSFYTYVTNEDGVDQFTYIFDKTLLATPEDITISQPDNLKLGNQGSVSTLYLLLM